EEETVDAASAVDLGLENVGGVFVVMAGGCALACLTTCCEFMWKARKLATDEGASFGGELGKELLFIINCTENSKPVRKKTSLASSVSGSSNYGYSAGRK
ncbi:Glutamate receptor ionotropic, kainate 3-like 2, partial [Homarus americanus]